MFRKVKIVENGFDMDTTKNILMFMTAKSISMFAFSEGT